MEAPSHYWLALYSFLIKHNYVVHVVNPIQTDSWRNSTKIRPHKTDKIDSLLIADFIRYGEYSETSLASEEILEIRNLSRFRISELPINSTRPLPQFQVSAKSLLQLF